MSTMIEKIMSITRTEFEASLTGLDPVAQLDADGIVRVTHAAGHGLIRFEALPKRRLGGLIHMPQARVTIDLAALPAPERSAFLRRFEIAFQRGGG